VEGKARALEARGPARADDLRPEKAAARELAHLSVRDDDPGREAAARAQPVVAPDAVAALVHR